MSNQAIFTVSLHEKCSSSELFTYKIFRETTLMLKIYLYIKKIYPIINYPKSINLECTLYN